jgi:hypothetical protein
MAPWTVGNSVLTIGNMVIKMGPRYDELLTRNKQRDRDATHQMQYKQMERA